MKYRVIYLIILVLAIFNLSFISTYAVSESDLDLNTDYASLMIQAAAECNVEAGNYYYDLREMKKECLGISDNITFNDLYLLSKIVQAEAGSSWITEEHRRLVASVVINRVNSPEFPNTIKEVIHQKGQYYPVSSGKFNSTVPSYACVLSAFHVLDNGPICPNSVVFQANFRQGSGTYKVISVPKLGNSYFCYANNMKYYK